MPEKETSNLPFDSSELNQDIRISSFGPTIASPFGSIETDESVYNSARRSSISSALQDSIHSLFSGVRSASHLKNDEELQALQIFLAKQSEVQSSQHAPHAIPSRSSSDGTAHADPHRNAATAHVGEDSDGAGRRSYRQQTSELISKLDKLLDFRHSKAPSKRKKSAEKRADASLLKPRARNVVLKVATELIRRMQLDDQALTLLKRHKTGHHCHQQQPATHQRHEQPRPARDELARRQEYCAPDPAQHFRQAWPGCPQPSSPPSTMAARDQWLGRDAAARLAAAAAASHAERRAVWEWMSGGAPLQAGLQVAAGMDSF